MQIEEAAQIIQSYVAVLQKGGDGATNVLDSSQMPLPKDQIQAAAVTLYQRTTDAAQKESFLGVAKSLALFQSDVGDTPLPLEGERSDGTAWRSIVEPEMLDIERSLNGVTG